MVFSTAHIALTALLVAVASAPVAAVMLRPTHRGQFIAVAVIAGLTTFGWRLAANVDALNRDGVTWVSGNDVLVGFLAYAILDMYSAFAPPPARAAFDRLRAVVAAIAIVVNVLAI